MSNTPTKVDTLQPGTVVSVPHVLAGTPTNAQKRQSRTVAKIAKHPVIGVTIWYTDTGPPDHFPPGAFVDVIS